MSTIDIDLVVNRLSLREDIYLIPEEEAALVHVVQESYHAGFAAGEILATFPLLLQAVLPAAPS